MKLIDLNNDTVTAQFSRRELIDIWHAMSDARQQLEREPAILRELIRDCEGIEDPDEIQSAIYEAGREEETVEGLQKSLKYAQAMLPKVYDFSDGFSRLAFQKTMNAE